MLRLLIASSLILLSLCSTFDKYLSNNIQDGVARSFLEGEL